MNVEFFVFGKAMGKTHMINTGKKIYTPHKVDKYIEQIQYYARRAMRGKPILTLGTQVALELWIVSKVPEDASPTRRAEMLSGAVRPTKKPNIASVVKSFTEACRGIVYVNERQVVAVSAVTEYGERDYVYVKISNGE